MDINLGLLLKLRTRQWAISRGYVDDEEKKKPADLYTDVLRPFIEQAFRHMPDQFVYAFVEDLSKHLKKNLIPDAREVRKSVSHGREEIYEAWTVIVPLRCPNGHNYELGQPVMCLGDNRAWKYTSNGMVVGNSLPRSKNDVRPATDEEIDKFLEGFKAEYMGKLMEMHQYVGPDMSRVPQGLMPQSMLTPVPDPFGVAQAFPLPATPDDHDDQAMAKIYEESVKKALADEMIKNV